MSANRLGPIVASVRARAAGRRAKQPLARLQDIVRQDSWRRERFITALSKPKLAIIAEMKRHSPSVGMLLEEERPSFARQPMPGPRWFALAQSYVHGGASALSVLTEEDHFRGTLDDMRAVEFTALPRLRKDFIVDEGMVLESCLYGADAILLLPCILNDGELALVRNIARDMGLAVLAEVHDQAELARVVPLEPELIGVNARDLSTFQVDLATVERILPLIPSGPIKVAESGIRGIDDLKRVRDAGAQAVLVGETLIKSGDARATLQAWNEALDA